MHSLNTFGARTNHRQPRTHKTHHGPNLGEAITFPLIVFSTSFNRATSKWHFVLGLLEFSQLGFSQFWGSITSRANFKLQWDLKQSCSPHQELSNNILHVAYTPGNRVDSRLLMVGSQIVSLTPDLSFDHNLCFKCTNGSCERILDI